MIGFAVDIGQKIYFHETNMVLGSFTSIYFVIFLVALVLSYFAHRNKVALFISGALSVILVIREAYGLIAVISGRIRADYINISDSDFLYLIVALLLSIYLLPKIVKAIKDYVSEHKETIDNAMSAVKSSNSGYSYLDEYKKNRK